MRPSPPIRAQESLPCPPPRSPPCTPPPATSGSNCSATTRRRRSKNFVDLATGGTEWTHPGTRTKTSDPLYDGTVFHRVIAGFMIQGGDPLGEGYGGPGYKFADEFHPELSFDRPYLLAMANSGPNTNGSQFFITVGRTPHLNRKHTIFGEVADADSRAVVDAIADHPDRAGRQADRRRSRSTRSPSSRG